MQKEVKLRRVETGHMPVIEEVECVDLAALFGEGGGSASSSIRMVKAEFDQEFEISEGDTDKGEKDEQHFWYEATKSQQD